MTTEQRPATVKVVVATTVMLSFISFWRAAAIVLSDLASSRLLRRRHRRDRRRRKPRRGSSWRSCCSPIAVRAIYIEELLMFVRGGVYKVVHEAMGGTLAQVLGLRPDVRLRADRARSAASARACTWADCADRLRIHLYQFR